MREMEIERKTIVDYWLRKLGEKEVLQLVEKQAPELAKTEANKLLKLERLQFIIKWKNSNFTKSRFMKFNAKWLQEKLVFPLKRTRGPHKKDDDRSCRKTKLNRLREIPVKFSAELLGLAAAAKFRASGHRLAAKLVENVSKSPEGNSPSSDKKTKTDVTLSPQEAIALISRNDFSKAQYKDLRATSLRKGVNLYPSYDRVLEEKKKCYPPGKKYLCVYFLINSKISLTRKNLLKTFSTFV